jgi:predicted nucleic acid-binding protein
MPLLVDTGILYALADRSDAWHARVRALVASTHDPLLAPVTILPEVTYLLATRLGAHAELAFVRSVVDGEIAIEPVTAAACVRAHEVMMEYPDIGFVDATLVATAERLKLSTIATTDRRHFVAIQPLHVRRFTLVPDAAADARRVRAQDPAPDARSKS